MGTTIGAVLISYDVNRSHTEVKARLEEMDYYDNFAYDNEPTKYLPNTTLWHKNKSSDQAINDLKSVCNSLGVLLEKAVSVRAFDFVGI
jgi:hypothetical protein